MKIEKQGSRKRLSEHNLIPQHLRDSATRARHSLGRKHYLRYINGDFISRSEAMLAKCSECTAFFADGLEDCKVYDCSLYPWQPYKKNI